MVNFLGPLNPDSLLTLSSIQGGKGIPLKKLAHPSGVEPETF
jgi:hypothetical protein